MKIIFLARSIQGLETSIVLNQINSIDIQLALINSNVKEEYKQEYKKLRVLEMRRSDLLKLLKRQINGTGKQKNQLS